MNNNDDEEVQVVAVVIRTGPPPPPPPRRPLPPPSPPPCQIEEVWGNHREGDGPPSKRLRAEEKRDKILFVLFVYICTGGKIWHLL